MRSIIKIYNTPCSGPGQSLTLAGYSSVLQNITWIQAIYVWANIYLTKISRTPDSALSFIGIGLITGTWFLHLLVMIENQR